MPVRLACVVLVIAMIGCPASRRDRPDTGECVTAADCAPGPAVNPDDVCCDTGVHLGVFSRKYLEWRARKVEAVCKEVTCPPIPSPALPLPCATEPRCVANRCTHSCEPPPAAPSP